MISKNLVLNLLFILFFVLSQNSKATIKAKLQVGGLVTRTISVFCLYEVTLYFRDMFDFNRLLYSNFLTCYSYL